MTKSAELQERLSKALPRVRTSRKHDMQERAQSRAPETSPANRNGGVRKGGAMKVSVSLYSPDLTRLDAIKAFMLTHGVRGLSDSEALRLAVRSAPLEENLVAIYEKMQLEDGRRI